MSQKISYPKFDEKAQNVPVDLKHIKTKEYGRVLEDLKEGMVFIHPRGITITKNFAIEFATQFMECNPLYLNESYARAHGFRDLVVSPMMVMNLALSLGVQNDSEKCIANLGYYNVCFVRPVYPNDTLRSFTKVLNRQIKEGKPGIVTIRTIALNQDDKLVLQYDRKIMVAGEGKEPDATPSYPSFPDKENPEVYLPETIQNYPKDLTGRDTYFENFNVGDILIHKNGRTITDEHIPWTYKVMNTHPLHYDRIYSSHRSGKMSGEPIVYGGLVFAWLQGLASRDTSENALVDFGYTEGYHTQPAFSGDTVYAISRVLEKSELETGLHAGLIRFQLIGVKNKNPKVILEQSGEDLFIKENDKKKLGKEKIEDKIFEIERRLLIKKK